MDAYLKLSKSLLKLGLNPKELSIMIHLLDIEDYRLYKNEVEDGWFTKSKRELANDCGISDRWINVTLDKLVDKGLIEIKSDSTSITQFKIIYRQNVGSDYRQNVGSDYRQNVALHNTINKTGHKTILSQEKQEKKKEEKEKEVINTGPLTISYIEKEKEDNIQPTVKLSIENSTVGELVEDYINNHNGKLEYLKCSNVNGFKLSNQDSLKEMTNIYGYLSIDDYRNMFVYLHKRN